MKKTIRIKVVALFILLMLSMHIKAQFSLGLGGTYSDVRHNNLLLSKKPIMGMFSGISLQYYPFRGSDKLSIINELNYVAKGYRQDFGKEQFNKRFHYLGLSVLLNYNVTPRFSLHGGAEFSGMTKKESSDKTKTNPDDVYKDFDIGLNLGAGYFVVPDRIQLFGRFNYGLLPQLNYYRIDELGNMNPVKDIKNMNIMVGLKIYFTNEKIYLFR